MSVEIKIYGDTAKEALAELIGFAGGVAPAAQGSTPAPVVTTPATTGAQDAAPASQVSALDEKPAEAPKRERGKPAEGRSRRTKEEIAEDEAADAATAASTATSANVPAEAATTNTAAAAQDKADEKAEVETNRKALTKEDVKAAMTGYVNAYGMAATQEDGPKIFTEALGAPPVGEDYWKLSLVPEDDQDALAKVVKTWEMATELNPLKRDAV